MGACARETARRRALRPALVRLAAAAGSPFPPLCRPCARAPLGAAARLGGGAGPPLLQDRAGVGHAGPLGGEARCRVVEVLGAGGMGKTPWWRAAGPGPGPGVPGGVLAQPAQRTAVRSGWPGPSPPLRRPARPPEGPGGAAGAAAGAAAHPAWAAGAGQPGDRAGAGGPECAIVRLRGVWGGAAAFACERHQGCLLLTSREQTTAGEHLADVAAVRTLRLGGLGVDDVRALLAGGALTGDDAAWQTLAARYAGNPLALHVVGETIVGVFGGDIPAFLAQDLAVFGGIRQLLDQQVDRISTLEHSVLTWLAVEREPVGFGELIADLGFGVTRGEVVEAVEALHRRSLLERGSRGGFTLQPVVMEYATTRLVTILTDEIRTGKPVLLAHFALVKAQARQYVRQSQERLIAQPLLDRLSTTYTNPQALEEQLLPLLEAWRERTAGEQGYGPGNVVNLLRLLRGDLRGLNLFEPETPARLPACG